MLRIIKDGKPLSSKEQEKLCEKDKTQNVGTLFVPPKAPPVQPYPGLKVKRKLEAVKNESAKADAGSTAKKA